MSTTHDHNIIDSESDLYFKIDIVTRAIVNESSSKKTTIMQLDHNSERFTFEMDKNVEGHDMSKCDSVQIHYLNTGDNRNDKNPGLYEVPAKDITTSVDGKKIIFSWLISDEATKFSGKLSFGIVFLCGDGTNPTYRWCTAINNTIVVSPTMNNGDVLVDGYPDLLYKWEQELTERLNKATIDLASEVVEDVVDGNITYVTAGVYSATPSITFENLKGITKIDWGDGVVEENVDPNNIKFEHTYNIFGMKTIKIFGLTGVQNYAFYKNQNIQTITFGNTITSLGSHIFADTNIKTIRFGNLVDTIVASNAFSSTSNLKEIDFTGVYRIIISEPFEYNSAIERIFVPCAFLDTAKTHFGTYVNKGTPIGYHITNAELDKSINTLEKEIDVRLAGKLDFIQPTGIATYYPTIIKSKNSITQELVMGVFTPSVSTYDNFPPVLRGPVGQVRGKTPDSGHDLDLINRVYLDKKLANSGVGGNINLDAYATKTYISDNYYNKTEIDNKVKDFINVSISDYYTKTEIDTKLSNIDLSDYYTKDEVDAFHDNYVLGSDLRGEYYNKTEIDENYYNKTEIDSYISVLNSDIVYVSKDLADNYYTKAQVVNLHSQKYIDLFKYAGITYSAPHGTFAYMQSTMPKYSVAMNDYSAYTLFVCNVDGTSISLYNESQGKTPALGKSTITLSAEKFIFPEPQNIVGYMRTFQYATMVIHYEMVDVSGNTNEYTETYTGLHRIDSNANRMYFWCVEVEIKSV